MADRSRSRSPDRRGDDHQPPSDVHPSDGDNGDDMGNGPSGDEVKLYVGNLDYGAFRNDYLRYSFEDRGVPHTFSVIFTATDEARLRSEFSQFGAVTEVFLPVERGTQRPRGFGFVTLATREAAERAITQMDQSQLDGVSKRASFVEFLSINIISHLLSLSI